MLQQLKRFSAKNAMATFLRRNCPKGVNEKKQIGIIFDFDIAASNFDLSEFRKELNVPYEDFFIIVTSKEKHLPEKYSLNLFDGKRLRWNATFEENGNEWNFAQRNYDILVNYFTNPTPEILILSASVKANLKVGFPLEEKRLNDLEINIEPKNHQLFLMELKKYIAVIV